MLRQHSPPERGWMRARPHLHRVLGNGVVVLGLGHKLAFTQGHFNILQRSPAGFWHAEIDKHDRCQINARINPHCPTKGDKLHQRERCCCYQQVRTPQHGGMQLVATARMGSGNSSAPKSQPTT